MKKSTGEKRDYGEGGDTQHSLRPVIIFPLSEDTMRAELANSHQYYLESLKMVAKVPMAYFVTGLFIMFQYTAWSFSDISTERYLKPNRARLSIPQPPRDQHLWRKDFAIDHSVVIFMSSYGMVSIVWASLLLVTFVSE